MTRAAALALLPSLAMVAPTVAAETSVFGAGAATLRPLLQAWVDGAGVSGQVEGRGSSTGPAALLRGRAEFAALDRALRADELRVLTRHFGEAPLVFEAATDAIVVVVHKSNPLPGSSLATLASIFSDQSPCQSSPPLWGWAEVGLPSPWLGRRIGVYGPFEAAGPRASFRHAVLCDGPYRAGLRGQPGGRAVVAAVSESPWAIGFVGLADLGDRVRALPISTAGEAFVAPDEKSVRDGSYPLARSLWLVMPPGPLSSERQRLLEFAFSTPGQAMTRRHGLLPASERATKTARKRLAP